MSSITAVLQPSGDTVALRAIGPDDERPSVQTSWEDWGDVDPAAAPADLQRWAVEWTHQGRTVVAGHLSAHSVWYGPSPGSRAMNIGISLVEEARGRGVGSMAQQLLAEHLHERGIVRVEASTDVANTAEQAALRRAGFSLEGVLRQAQGRRDGQHDLQMWSHIRRP